MGKNNYGFLRIILLAGFIFLFACGPSHGQVDSTNVKTFFSHAVAQMREGKYDLALADLNKILDFNPNHVGAYTNRAYIHVMMGRYDLAISDANKALRLNPKNAGPYNNRGLAYYSMKQYDRAISDYEEALKINANSWRAYHYRGLAYREKRQYDNAFSDFNKALKINPKSAGVYNNRGLTYQIRGEYDSAISDLDRAIELNPKFEAAYRNRGDTYHSRGQYEQAILDFRKALEINPGNAETSKRLDAAYGAKSQSSPGQQQTPSETPKTKAELKTSKSTTPEEPSTEIAGKIAKSEETLPAIVKRIQAATVLLRAYKGESSSQASGFFIGQKGEIITSYHVLKDSTCAEIRTSKGDIYPIKKIVAEDKKRDLIRVSVDIASKDVFPLSMSGSTPEAGERIVVIGNPLGLEQTVSDGIVSAIRNDSGYGHIIQITAPLSAASIGSPVVNMRGEVIGVAFLQIVEGQNLNFAVPGERVIELTRHKENNLENAVTIHRDNYFKSQLSPNRSLSIRTMNNDHAIFKIKWNRSFSKIDNSSGYQKNVSYSEFSRLKIEAGKLYDIKNPIIMKCGDGYSYYFILYNKGPSAVVLRLTNWEIP